MNDEYLWNKMGRDPEIENLEKALAVFRYREATTAEPLPRKEEATAGLRRFRFSFAFAFASVAIVGILVAVWLRMPAENSKSENAGEIVFVQESTDALELAPTVEPTLPPTRNPDSHGRPPGTRSRTFARTSAVLRRRQATKDLAPKDSIAGLTNEERFAYRQLMLALSITSSKLKIVQDTIDGTQAAEDDSKNQR